MGNHSLQDKTAVVTGASSGIGRATALALAEQGARVALMARRQEALEKVAADIRALGREALVLPADVTVQAQVQQAIAEVVRQWGRVDILVSNAGTYYRRPVDQLDPEIIERSMAVNFYGGLYAILAVLPHMIEGQSGHLVLVTSLDGRKGLPLDAPYVVAKFAMTGLGDCLRQELRGKGIHTTTVMPGRVDTPLLEDIQVPWISAKISPETVARGIVRAIKKRQPVVITPLTGRFLYLIDTISPRIGDWIVRAFHLEGRQS
ncbi:MAG: SDR family NAD(P)-dependent oxidoreductase [Chloroflexi bacterium]|nr:SDR family NAD(P)-dependent oxidoreductase [Chloroflexota bacterium]